MESACLACGLADGTIDLPGGPILATEHWRVEHCVGPLPLGTLVVKPRRHVLRLADLDEAEAAELGPLLRDAADVVQMLSEASQIYTCLWSTGPVHIHFVVQPETPELVAEYGARGPALQTAMFERGIVPDPALIDAYAARAGPILRRRRRGLSNL